MTIPWGERGGFVLGMVVGLLIGLSLALGVALYITKAPIPFVNKVPPRTAEQDQAEAARNKGWDPNAPLAGKPSARPAPAAAGASAPAATAAATPAASPAASTPPTTRDPAAILSGAATPGPGGPRSTTPAADPFVYFVQVGAYSNPDEAEQQRAKLALSGLSAKITEREQSGRTVFRVRLGPFQKRDEAEIMQGKLGESGVDARLVAVEKSAS